MPTVRESARRSRLSAPSPTAAVAPRCLHRARSRIPPRCVDRADAPAHPSDRRTTMNLRALARAPRASWALPAVVILLLIGPLSVAALAPDFDSSSAHA